jgi:DNA-binding transcriptional ArsR family regulator
MNETKERHRRYLRAVNNPVRRDILRSINRGNKTFSAIIEEIELNSNSLEWHLNILVDGFVLKLKTRLIRGDTF